MQDYPPSGQPTENKPHRSLFERLTAFISPEPENRSELLELLHDAHDRNLILLAKDLLRYYAEETFDVRGMLRPSVFIPESKRLNILLRDFRSNRNHIAIVVDEYGGVAGLCTIEDVLEQIVGDIEDEHDIDEEEDNILPIQGGANGQRWRIKALTEIAQLNEEIGTNLNDDDVDTIGGLVANHLGRMPRKGEIFEMDHLRFEVLRADARQVHVLLLEKCADWQSHADS